MIRILVYVLIGVCSTAMATEERAFTSIKKDGEYEVRRYHPTVIIKVTQPGKRRDTANSGFRTLFQYIDGNNEKQTKIPMTTPVSQFNNKTEWSLAFFLPQSMTHSSAPKPTNELVEIHEIPEQTLLTIRFSGNSNEHNMKKHTEKLILYAKEHNYKTLSTPTYAFYDPPFMPWFLRRNEIWIEIEMKKE